MFVLKEDWAWLVGHAHRNTDDKEVDRWTCKASGTRIMVGGETPVQVEDVEGNPEQATLVRPVCPKCKEVLHPVSEEYLKAVIPHVDVIPITLVP